MPESIAPPPFGNSPLTVEWPILVNACHHAANREHLQELLRQSPDWSVLVSLAEEHGVTRQLAHELRNFPGNVPGEVQQKLLESNRSQVLATLGIIAELFRLLQWFRSKGMQVLVIKGPVLSARAYGDACARQYGDLDLLLRSGDIERATQLMKGAGYEPRVPLNAIKGRKIPGEYAFRNSPEGILVELHTEQSLRYFPRALPIDEYFSRQANVEIDGRAVPAMAPEDEFVHICVHGTKHLWERLKWIADVSAILRKGDDLNWERVRESADRAGTRRMLHVGMLLANDILGDPLPEKFKDPIRRDEATMRIVPKIKQRLPFAGYRSPGLLERAAYRSTMRGGGLAGAAYLWRLSTSPTESDWKEETGSRRTFPLDTLRRLMRLARLYGRGGK